MDSQKRQWRTLFEVSKIASIINSSLEHDEIVRRAVEYIPDAIGAEAASLILKDDQGLYFHLATGEGGDKVKKIRLKMGEGVAGWVAERGEVAIVNDPYNDPRFYEGADRQSGFTTRNILCVPLMLRDELKGVVEVINRREGDFTEDDASVLKCLSNQIAISLENSRLYQEMKSTFQSMVEVLAELIELRDHYTGGHTERVKRYSLLVGERMGLSTEETEALQLAAVLHDVGKIGVRDAILLKGGKLDAEEYKLMSMHAEFGAKVLERVENLNEVIAGIRHHHERFEGGGYPDGLKGEEIPLIARIISVTDTFDAMTTTRPYREALSPDEAVRELHREAGRQFDPEVVKVFVELYEEGVIP